MAKDQRPTTKDLGEFVPYPMFRRHVLPIFLIVATGVLLALGLLFAHIANSPTRVTSNPDKSLQDFYTEAQTRANIPEQRERKATFLAVGDISLSRNVAATIQTKNDVLYPFKGVEALLKSTDFNFGNLETPFSKSDAFTADNTLVFNAPKNNVAGLKEYNFKVLNLANNHAFDQGLDGITTTSQVLDNNNILHMGTGKSLDEAWTPAIIEMNGIKIGFLGASYASSNDGGKTTNDYVARIEDLNRLRSNVNGLRSNVDFIVVTMHAGTEYTPTGNASQVAFAHAAIDAGADLVLGAHPHWVQNKELYCPESKQTSATPEPNSQDTDIRSNSLIRPFVDSDSLSCKWIYYSLGNFMFDQSWSEETKKGLALKIVLTKQNQTLLNNLQQTVDQAQITEQNTNKNIILNIEEIPIYIENNCCPVVFK